MVIIVFRAQDLRLKKVATLRVEPLASQNRFEVFGI